MVYQLGAGIEFKASQTGNFAIRLGVLQKVYNTEQITRINNQKMKLEETNLILSFVMFPQSKP